MATPGIRRGLWLAVAFAATVCVAAASAAAQGAPPPAGATPIERGKTIYLERCAVCHGDRGRGNGPAAPALRTRPTNLAKLRKRNGIFPADRVEGSIKGTTPVVAHGATGMMVWGAFFLADANGNQAGADARIRDVMAFIESFQVN